MAKADFSRLTTDQILAQISAARASERAARASGKRADHASYDAARRELRITFPNGVSAGIPVGMIDSLKSASPKALREVEVSPSGASLHFETLDVDLSVPALLAMAFKGTVATTALGTIAGSTISERKSAAARENGKRGGRPRKQANSATRGGKARTTPLKKTGSRKVG